MSESIQKILSRIRAPRVQITYDVQIGDAVERKELPFVIGVFADLSAHNNDKPKLSDRKFVEIDRDNFNQVLASIKPYLNFRVRDVISEAADAPDIEIAIALDNIDNFHPSYLLQNIPVLNEVYQSRIRITDLIAKIDSNDLLEESLRDCLAAGTIGDIEQLISSTKMSLNDDQVESCKLMLTDFSKYMTAQDDADPKDPYSYATKLIVKIDGILSLQMNEVLHNEEFQAFEGSVRSLHYLVMNSETGQWLKIRVMNISKDELFKDLEKAVEFDQSKTFKKVYEEEYGTFGGNPYSCLIGAYSFGRNPRDVAMLRKISGIAAAAHAPFIAAASTDMFGLQDFTEIGSPRDLQKVFESSEYTAWNSFRALEDARYVSLVMPRIMIRQIYSPTLEDVNEFNYTETVDGSNNNHFCWGNPAFAVATRITAAFSKYGWTAAIRGYEGGGAIENLPVYTYRTSNGDLAVKCPTEVTITDRRERELESLGFLAVCHRVGTDVAAVFGGQTVHKPKKYDKDESNANALLSCKLPYILNVSRFAHYIKVIMRDKIGSFASKEEVRIFLQNWLGNYVLLSDIASQESKAKFPLREGRVDVFEEPGRAGSYRAIMYLRPHFQMEDLTVSLRLVARLPEPIAA
jgi:type VI secretion system protein ImpC